MNNVSINDIKFNGWEVIAILTNFDYLSMREMATVFIRSGEYNFYNKKELNLKVLDKGIKEFLDIGTIDGEFIANELKSIKRDLVLKKII